MIQFLVVLISAGFSAQAAKPRFHCHTAPNQFVSAYQSPVKCGGKKGDMEVVCTYVAGCKPADKPGEPEIIPEHELQVQITSGELKGSFLICKGVGQFDKSGRMISADCPSPTRCQGDGLYDGIVARVSPRVPIAVETPVKGKSNATR